MGTQAQIPQRTQWEGNTEARVVILLAIDGVMIRLGSQEKDTPIVLGNVRWPAAEPCALSRGEEPNRHPG